MYVGKKIKEFREAENLTQYEFAEILGVSQPYYSAIEGSKKPITKKLLKRMSDKWGIKKEFFQTEKNDITGEEIGGVLGGVPEKEVLGEGITQHFYPAGSPKFHLDLRNFVTILHNDIEKNNPEFNLINKSLYALQNFLDIGQWIYKTYFEGVKNQLFTFGNYVKDGRFNYPQYKADHIELLTQIKPFEPALNALLMGFNSFYDELLKVDTKNTLNGMEEVINYQKLKQK